MKPLPRLAAVSALVCSINTTASAHPGHGDPGPAHYFTSPAHLLPVLGVSLVVMVAVMAWRAISVGRPQKNR